LDFDPTTYEMSDVFSKLSEAIDDPTITRIFTLSGRPIDNPKNIPKAFVALNQEEKFFWPGIEIGYVANTEGIVDRDIKVTTLSIRPHVLLLENFMSPEECDYVIEKAKGKGLGRSQTFGNGTDDYQVGDVRTSTGCFLEQHEDSGSLKVISERASNFTTLPANYSEQIQVIHYDKQQHYHAHYDYIPNSGRTDYMMSGQNRLVTLLLYLSDVEEGGETVFPFSNPNFNENTDGYGQYLCEEPFQALRPKPKKGNAVLFYGMTEKGHMLGYRDDASLHGGCDVKQGEKWAANFWFHNYVRTPTDYKAEHPIVVAKPVIKDGEDYEIMIYDVNGDPDLPWASLMVKPDTTVTELRIMIEEQLDDPPHNYVFVDRKTGIKIQKKQETSKRVVNFILDGITLRRTD